MYYFSPSMSSSPYYWQRAPWMYIKWGKPQMYPRRRNYGKFGSWYELPDREIIICHESERPQYVDEAIDLNPMTSPMFNNVDYYLIGQGSGRRPSPHHQWHRPEFEVITDSGGAQLRTGGQWVDPEASMNFMNLSGDIGIILDMPLRSADADAKSITKLAKSQRRLTNWMLKSRREDLSMLNVAHGDTIDHFRIWHDTVADDRLDGWAVGSEWMLGILAYENPDAHLHCLGFGSLYPSVAWAGKYVKLLTSDSSTWSTVFRNSNVPFQGVAGGTFDYTMFGGSKRYANHQFHLKGRLACSCPVCSKVGWYYPFINARGQDIRFLVACHVLQTQFLQAEALNRMVQESKTVEHYVDKIVEWFGGTSPSNNKDKAQKRFKKAYDPRWCPFCGREADRGKGDFPCCKQHSRLSDYVAGIYQMEELIRDPDTHVDDNRPSSKKTGYFGAKKIFAGPDAMFSRKKGTHLTAMASKTQGDTGLKIAKRYRQWTKERAILCSCFDPKIELKLVGKGGNIAHPTEPPFEATCTRCNKRYPLAKPPTRKRKAEYHIMRGKQPSGEPAFTVKEALTRINAKWAAFIDSGGDISHLCIRKTKLDKEGAVIKEDTIHLKLSKTGNVTTKRGPKHVKTKEHSKTAPDRDTGSDYEHRPI